LLQQAKPFPVASYSPADIRGSFNAIKKHWPNGEVRVAVWNAGFGVWKGFLDVTDEEVQKSVNDNIIGPFAFSKEAILAFKGLECVSFFW
jgi:NAD(P)-dependent dehydrogenase (short-subunit alcohol dehydrogenase family)